MDIWVVLIFGMLIGLHIWEVYPGGLIYREHINGILRYVKKHQSAVIYKVLYLL